MTSTKTLVGAADDDDEPGDLGDRTLLRRYREGDTDAQDAFEKLYKRYYGPLKKLASQRLGGFLKYKEESSDIVQEVLKTVFMRGRDGRIVVGSSGSLWPLLIAITVNKIYSMARFHGRDMRDARRQKRLGGHDPMDREPTAQDWLEVEELIAELCRSFSERDQKIIRLLVQDTPVKDIAGEVGTARPNLGPIFVVTFLHLL